MFILVLCSIVRDSATRAPFYVIQRMVVRGMEYGLVVLRDQKMVMREWNMILRDQRMVLRERKMV